MLPYAKQISAAPEEISRSGWVAGSSIVAYGVRVGIRTNKQVLLDRLLARIPDVWKQSSAPSVERLFSLRVGTTGVRKNGRSLHELYEDRQVVASSEDLDLILESFEKQLKMYVAEMARHRVFVHAGAVEWRGKLVIVPGRSLSGKTSLVAELVRAGATYYSDEYAVLDKHGRVHPYPTPLAIREPGTYRQKNCPAQELGGSIGRKPLPVSLIVVSRYKPGGSWRPRQLSPGQAMLELLDNTVPARRKPEAVMVTLRRVVSGAVMLKSARGEAEETAGQILGYLNGM